jgi:hypothetical protein
MRVAQGLAALFLLLAPACASHFTTLTVPASHESWPSLRAVCAEVATQFQMFDRASPSMGHRADSAGWYALAFYENSRRTECQYEAIYLLADGNLSGARARFMISNFSSGSESSCAALIRQALVSELARSGFDHLEVEHRSTRALPP